jgi:protein-tyrosine phosphatase
MKILFVCAGNICRSPTAEGVMVRLVGEAGLAGRVELDSAGTGGWHVGELPDPRTVEAARRRGVDLAHRARQLRAGDLERFDLVLVMDGDNLRHVTAMAGLRARDKVRLLRSFDPEAPAGAFVPDPYAGGPAGFDEVLDQCERACAGLLRHVREALQAAR